MSDKSSITNCIQLYMDGLEYAIDESPVKAIYQG